MRFRGGEGGLEKKKKININTTSSHIPVGHTPRCTLYPPLGFWLIVGIIVNHMNI